MAAKRSSAARGNDAVDQAADELYGLPADDFTAARNERAKAARAAGDTGAAEVIGKLGKPNAVAWLANQLVREHRDEVEPLLELGASFREATSSLDADQMRELSRQRHELIYALVQQARRLASDAGVSVSDATARGLEDTLHAAMAEEDAGRELSSGRLTSGLSASGFPGIATDRTQAAAPTKSGAAKSSGKNAGRSKADRQHDDLEQAERDEDDARAAVEQKENDRDEAEQALDKAQQQAQDAAGTVERIKAELGEAQSAQTDADRAVRAARKDVDRADRAAKQAVRKAEDASVRRKQLQT